MGKNTVYVNKKLEYLLHSYEEKNTLISHTCNKIYAFNIQQNSKIKMYNAIAH